MASIASYLTTELSNLFTYLFGVNEVLRVTYNGRDNMDFIFGPLGYVKKILVKNGIQMDPIAVYRSVHENLVLQGYEIGINADYLYFNSKYDNTANYLKQVFSSNLIPTTTNPQNILVDFSSPNIAKNMHVGHLRSTIIGDSICRLFETFGHNVHRVNHIGDFGLPFGMLIELLITEQVDIHTLTIDDLQQYYVSSQALFKKDEAFQRRAHARMVQLQNGHLDTVMYWNHLKTISLQSYHEIYDKLNINLSEVGESFYQPFLPDLVTELEAKNLLVSDNGRRIIQVPSYEKEPLTVVKKDGGFVYDSTDLAAIRYRLINLKMDQVIYVVDAGQKSHFDKVFWVAQQCGWCQPHQKIIHTPFGLVLNENKSKMKSRENITVKLVDLLDRSLVEVAKIVSDRSLDHQQQTIRDIAYGSIKYYDLSMKRTSDYVFSFDKILSLNGNSGPYLLYANARINAIIAKSGLNLEQIMSHLNEFEITNADESRLCLLILQLTDVLVSVLDTLMFHHLTKYMHTLACAFHAFIQSNDNQCLKFNKETNQITEINYNRILLCHMTQTILEKCFSIIGMNPIRQM